ncbi:hypothetical protein MPTK1_5g20250 [Marchantia polymorpha subsp. ruderalis]|uniref:Uncharacterized protein n=2 Tax=Marchantia polymorpha TaxID=3197 RepID=A0AAF6BKC4_MARPO|nr:hypothetical protein MARPO_0340s0002 [Marchantia polymorpha]BBN12458.1 hypothetical protein Mp_5g20250 [Marchantia polymorpha subsp. ruderalis]|eukprot:PTQ26818.1 hypothetical protein MARPO_0340s0002 [Marchantia polymorpha]
MKYVMKGVVCMLGPAFAGVFLLDPTFTHFHHSPSITTMTFPSDIRVLPHPLCSVHTVTREVTECCMRMNGLFPLQSSRPASIEYT